MSNLKSEGHPGTTKSLPSDTCEKNSSLVIVDNEIDELEVMKRSLEKIQRLCNPYVHRFCGGIRIHMAQS